MPRLTGFPLLISATLAAAAPEAFEGLKFHQAPKPLAEGAVTQDWHRFLGPFDKAITTEKPLLDEWPESGLPIIWEMVCGDGYAAPAVIDGRLVYFHNRGGHERLVCLDPETGRRHWEFAYPVKYRDRYGYAAGPRGSPVIDGGIVYAAGVTAMLHALELKTGKLLWKHETGAEINSSANFFKDSVLVGSQDGTLYRFLTKDGSIVWKYTIEASGGIQCSPTLGENRAFIGGCDGNLHVIDVDKGTSVATLNIGDPTLSTPAVAGDEVFLGTEGANLLGINWRQPKILWTYANPRRRTSYRSSPAVTEQVVVIGGRNKLVEAIDRKTGKPSWSFATKGRVDSSPVIAGDRVFFGSADGRLYELALATGKTNWSYDAGSGFDASPAVAEGRLVIGNEDGVLYCFGQQPPDELSGAK